MTNLELVSAWNYFQVNYAPTLKMTLCALYDNMDSITSNKSFYRHTIKQEFNGIKKDLEMIYTKIVSPNNVKHNNWNHIFCCNIEEIAEKDIDILKNTVRMSFQKALMDINLDFFVAFYHIDYMLYLTKKMFYQCCSDLNQGGGIHFSSPLDTPCETFFRALNVEKVHKRWQELTKKAIKLLPKENSKGKPIGKVVMNTSMHTTAINCLFNKVSDIEALRTAAELSYPYSERYSIKIPFEESRDYAIFNGGATKSGKTFPSVINDDDYFCKCCGKRLTKEEFLKNDGRCEEHLQ